MSEAARLQEGSTGSRDLERLLAGSGLAFQWGALDFAGGTVVHVSAGIAGLAGALMAGPGLAMGGNRCLRTRCL